ncbi:hypothetical protein XELAEV_18021843mg [Xenopus laevis]|uniref:Uncharacterized protein n=1 Tax=Xenopus laevis TaxID=8355 RepID=A0A974HN20_XENLA|nr:hypothetical protein XELAEV_18021843mg [Xenopus laevis]
MTTAKVLCWGITSKKSRHLVAAPTMHWVCTNRELHNSEHVAAAANRDKEYSHEYLIRAELQYNTIVRNRRRD